ncbi:hypothetical protein BRC81_01185 [Halobacteriales archaeon QS_1_68_20]|nr:MAG: hypothetical protein BRC81_01185 [Halobacteriales archaeon QS_1_68_20]
MDHSATEGIRMDKEHLLEHVKVAREHYLDSLIAFHRAEKAVGAKDPEDAVPYLRETSDHLQSVIEEIETALDMAHQTGDAEVSEAASDDAARDRLREQRAQVLERLKQEADGNDYFYDDPELWDYLSTSALADDPIAGYAMLADFATRFRNRVDGIVEDIQRDPDFDHVEQELWRATRLHLRMTNLGVMISFINRETRE